MYMYLANMPTLYVHVHNYLLVPRAGLAINITIIRERERERDRQTERERQRQRQKEMIDR